MALTIHAAAAFCGSCGMEKAGPLLPCGTTEPYTSEGGVDWPRCPDSATDTHDCAGDGACGAYPDGELYHEPTWCVHEGPDGGMDCGEPATAIVVTEDGRGLAVCDGHRVWALDHAEAEAP